MGNYITLHRGDMRGDHELTLEGRPLYLVHDLSGLIESLVIGANACAPTEGLEAALEDGKISQRLYAAYGRKAIDEAAREIKEILKVETC